VAEVSYYAPREGYGDSLTGLAASSLLMIYNTKGRHGVVRESPQTCRIGSVRLPGMGEGQAAEHSANERGPHRCGKSLELACDKAGHWKRAHLTLRAGVDGA
jgi:hypothetical protein